MRTILIGLLLSVAIAACNDSKKPAKAKPVDDGKQLVTDPTEQVLMLRAGIAKKQNKLAELASDEAKRKQLELELDILEKNLARIQQKLKH